MRNELGITHAYQNQVEKAGKYFDWLIAKDSTNFKVSTTKAKQLTATAERNREEKRKKKEVGLGRKEKQKEDYVNLGRKGSQPKEEIENILYWAF